MKQTTKDVINLLKNDTPENRAKLEENYGAVFLKVLTNTLIDNPDMMTRDLVTLIVSYNDPSVIDALVRAFRRNIKNKATIFTAISQFEDKRATKFLLSQVGSDEYDEAVKDIFEQSDYHAEKAKSMNAKPKLINKVSKAVAKSKQAIRRCARCNRSENETQIVSCSMCRRPFCVNHLNYFGRYCSITCAK